MKVEKKIKQARQANAVFWEYLQPGRAEMCSEYFALKAPTMICEH
jgi:hypothetical protein